MRYTRLLVTALILMPASIPYAQSSGSAGKLVAPGIEVLFSQNSPNSCAWRFRNADPMRTLQSMRFSYTYSASPVGRVPIGTSGTQSGADVLTDPLGPFEESSSNNLYRAQGNCATVSIRVTASQWL